METIKLIISIFWTVLAIVFSFLYWINFARVFFLERKIKNMYKQRVQEIKKLREQPIQNSIIEGKSKMISRDFDEQIAPLERERKYILDKLPFIR